MNTRVKTSDEITAMRESGQMLATILELLKTNTAADLTPRDMSSMANQELKKLGGEAAFKGYQGYPDVICISVNNQVQHSIPTNKPFALGDVINYDFGVRYRGMITDAGITIGVGQIDAKARRLIEGTKQALEAGIQSIKNGCRVGDISSAIEQVLKSHDLGIVQELVGHGVGHFLHEEPNIPNYGHPGQGPVLKTGMTVAIEPIATLGSPKIISDRDGWTLWTADGSLAAQFEHTVLITDDGCEVLTALK